VNPLSDAISSFPLRDLCKDPNFCAGDCDNISGDFLKHAESLGFSDGILLAVDGPVKPLDSLYVVFGEHEGINHYLAYFPSLDISVDWSARQFWTECPVPVVADMASLKGQWKGFPFGTNDARSLDPETFGCFYS